MLEANYVEKLLNEGYRSVRATLYGNRKNAQTILKNRKMPFALAMLGLLQLGMIVIYIDIQSEWEVVVLCLCVILFVFALSSFLFVLYAASQMKRYNKSLSDKCIKYQGRKEYYPVDLGILTIQEFEDQTPGFYLAFIKYMMIAEGNTSKDPNELLDEILRLTKRLEAMIGLDFKLLTAASICLSSFVMLHLI